jgi:vacuolar-type H+-ATPase subunit E/Vma4
VSDGEGGELLLNKKDRDAYGEAIISELASRRIKGVTLAPDSANITGGVIIRRNSIELNCALDVIVRMLSEETAFEVSSALFS